MIALVRSQAGKPLTSKAPTINQCAGRIGLAERRIGNVQIPQGIHTDSGRPKSHAGADAGVKHPVRQYGYDTRFDLNMDDAAAGALLAVLCPYTSAVERLR